MHRWEHNTLANYNTNGNSRSVRHVRACTVAQKIVHARPLHSAVSNADWSDAGKRRTRLQILHLPKGTRSILKCSICIRILLSSAMPSLSSSVSAAMIVVRQGGPCGRGTEFVDIEFIVLLCRTCGGTRPWNS